MMSETFECTGANPRCLLSELRELHTQADDGRNGEEQLGADVRPEEGAA